MHWACDLCTVTSVQGGANHNLKAFGFGSNAKARKRAGRLALAAFVRAQSAETRIEDPTETGDFQQLVDYVRQLSQGGGAADGRAPWWQEMSTEVEQQPALEAPPPTSSTAASWLLQAEVAPPASPAAAGAATGATKQTGLLVPAASAATLQTGRGGAQSATRISAFRFQKLAGRQ